MSGRVRVGDVVIDGTSADALLRALIRRDLTGGHHFVNAFSIVSASKGARLRASLDGGHCHPDGAPVALALRAMMGEAAPGRVRGPDFFEAAFDQGRAHGLKHFLLGGNELTITLLQEALQTRYPGVQIVGAESPPFAPYDQTDWAPYQDRILASGADVVWVGLGTPKQDYAVADLTIPGGIPWMAVGAAFDFSAGAVKRAPEWMQACGLEWLHRLISEPSRLWRRYLIGNGQFLAIVARNIWSHGR